MNYTVKLNPAHSQWRPVAQYSVPVTEVTVTESVKPRVEPEDRKSTRLNSSHSQQSRMPSSA